MIEKMRGPLNVDSDEWRIIWTLSNEDDKDVSYEDISYSCNLHPIIQSNLLANCLNQFKFECIR